MKKGRILIVVCMIVACIAIIIVGNSRTKALKQELIGKTFVGTFRTTGRAGFYDNQIVTLHINDDDTCNIKAIRDSSFSPEDTHLSASHIPYSLSGTKLSWNSGKEPQFMHCYKPFKISKKGGVIELTTPNYRDGTSLTLKQQ